MIFSSTCNASHPPNSVAVLAKPAMHRLAAHPPKAPNFTHGRSTAQGPDHAMHKSSDHLDSQQDNNHPGDDLQMSSCPALDHCGPEVHHRPSPRPAIKRLSLKMLQFTYWAQEPLGLLRYQAAHKRPNQAVFGFLGKPCSLRKSMSPSASHLLALMS